MSSINRQILARLKLPKNLKAVCRIGAGRLTESDIKKLSIATPSVVVGCLKRSIAPHWLTGAVAIKNTPIIYILTADSQKSNRDEVALSFVDVLFSDISGWEEVDQYSIDATNLFTNTANGKNLSLWSVSFSLYQPLIEGLEAVNSINFLNQIIK